MSTPFVAELRSRPDVIRVGNPGSGALTIRVEMPEVWDVVRMAAPSETPVMAVKTRALEALLPEATAQEDFVLKLRGWEILDETATLADASVIDGSILLLTYRRRRAVK